jgi:hypothetical protein
VNLSMANEGESSAERPISFIVRLIVSSFEGRWNGREFDRRRGGGTSKLLGAIC